MTGQEKFDGCRFRSVEKYPLESASIGGCGGCKKTAGEGYFCLRLGLDDINPTVCKVCDYFEERKAIQD